MTTSAYSADPVFEANGKLISYLLQRIHDRELALPDFQRDFVWDSRSTLELLRSIMSRFPAGTLLVWKLGEANEGFAARAVEGAPPLEGKSPDELVLDGQQRLTSLYRALTGTTDERYFVRLKQFLSPENEVLKVHEVSFEQAIFVVDLGSKLPYDPLDRSWQFAETAFPLAELSEFDAWLDNYARSTSGDPAEEDVIKKIMRNVRDAFLVPLRSYGFPVVTLPASTALEAVCNIFETLNRTGKPLGAFDLVTARLYPRGINLRDLWDQANDKYSALEDFDIEPYAILQAVCLRAHRSAQRSDVLSKLEAADVLNHWEAAASGAAAVLDYLASEHGVLSKRWLPYGMLLVPMAAIWPEIRAMKPLDRAGALERLSRYFWCTTFMTNFDQGANSQAGADYLRLAQWIIDGSATAPEAVEEFSFATTSLRSATVRRKALHAGIMALTIKSGAKDFHAGTKLTIQKVRDKKVDSHHVFPRAFLVGSKESSDLILNRALIDSETNKIIGKQSPSSYLGRMREAYGAEKMLDVLDSHAIQSGADSGLEQDDYGTYLDERLVAVIGLIEDATGATVVPIQPE